jgi:hypothetical protein
MILQKWVLGRSDFNKRERVGITGDETLDYITNSLVGSLLGELVSYIVSWLVWSFICRSDSRSICKLHWLYNGEDYCEYRIGEVSIGYRGRECVELYSIPRCAFMAWCSVKREAQGQFYR